MNWHSLLGISAQRLWYQYSLGEKAGGIRREFLVSRVEDKDPRRAIFANTGERRLEILESSSQHRRPENLHARLWPGSTTLEMHDAWWLA
jgi:hypothetical protein